ncbi:MAG: acriflavin resistance protein [Candidatus Riflebacteria bacterium HGW-Riflebacteria-1]|jgi:HAE1 family hydrophobic/amphiphilic exporter-1|nr:MAG: acriflavin resistance protein [Candidatus Riflebacteria bacterium HGW-Riflebacteria-1]
MILADISVKRPIGVTMIMCIVIIFGVISLYKLPVDLMPDITYPTITVSARYSNASPTEVETLITRPIEQAVAAVPGVEEINSTSTEGNSRVRISFAWGIDLDAASNDLRDRIDRIMARLPEDVERPTIRKFDAAALPVLIIGASSDLDPVQMLNLIEDQVKYRIERIPGVAAIDVMGGSQREIQVNIDINRVRALRIAPDQVISRLRAENLNLPAGLIESGNYELRLRTPGEFKNVKEIERLVIGETAGKLIRLRDVANVLDLWEKRRSIVRINGKPGVRVMVNKQSGSNTVAVAKAVKSELEKINQEIPQLRLAPIVDSSKYIERSINNVSTSAFYGGLLAIVILQLFLGNLASTAIIGTAIPVSIIATFALMYYFGFTLNIMSLGGVALGIGMLVDNSIVVLENIFRHRERGLGMMQAAIAGSSEVAMPVLASTMTTVVIFLPLLFVEGMTGVMFKQLAYIVGFSLLCSMLIALTIVPMLTSRYLNISNDRKGIFRRFSEKVINTLLAAHRFALDVVLQHRKKAVFVLGIVSALALGLARNIGTELMPTADEGEVRVNLELEEGTRLSLVERIFTVAEKVIMETVPEAETVFVNVGGGMGGGGGALNSGSIRVPLKGSKERKRSSAAVSAELRRKLVNTPGAVIRIREGQGMFMMRMGSGNADKLEVQIRGFDFKTADLLGADVQAMLKGVEGITDVQLSREKGVPERLVVIDRAKAADQKLTIAKVSSFLETMMSGSSAGNLREGGDEYRILVKARDAEFMKLDEILNMTVTNSAGKQVMLRNIAHIESQQGPTQVERRDQERVLNVSANVEGRALGFVIQEVQQKLREIPLPANFSIVMAGDYEEQQKSFRELLFSFFLALILVYMVMAVQYESLYDPIIVMFTVPFSLLGVIPMLYFTGTTLNVQSFIGCIMLGGIVVNNSILLVDHINDLRSSGRTDLMGIIREATHDRCRPIMMTALTTMLGLLPLAIGIGEGGEVQAPMARAVIGGLICSTFISLLFIPIVYYEFEQAFRSKPFEKKQDDEATA